MRHHRQATAPRGFTLLELMVALLLGAIVITPLYFVTRGMAESSQAVQKENEAMQRARIGLATLLEDLKRAGLMTSVNPDVDPDALEEQGNNAAYARHAVAHLNRSSDGPDTVMLVGNFVTSRTYNGAINDDGTVCISFPFAKGDCQREFDERWSFVRLTSKTGRAIDLRVGSVDETTSSFGTDDPTDADTSFFGSACNCKLTINDDTTVFGDPRGFTAGESGLIIQANQAVVYRVESERFTEPGATCGISKRVLVRYFARYQAKSGFDCRATNLTVGECTSSTADGVQLCADSRTVVADYVQDFQVWFRTTLQGTGTPLLASYANIEDLTHGFVPLSAPHLNTIQAFSANDLGCGTKTGSGSYTLGPEHVRSALVRLVVRAEQTDPRIEYGDFLNGTDGVSEVVSLSIAPGPGVDPNENNDTDTTNNVCPDVGSYHLRTLVTEVPMPNLATRPGLARL